MSRPKNNIEPAKNFVIPEQYLSAYSDERTVLSIKKDIKRENKTNGFFSFPYFLQFTYPYCEMNTTEKWIYSHILNYTMDPKVDGCFETPSVIAERLGLSERSVKETITALLKKKILREDIITTSSRTTRTGFAKADEATREQHILNVNHPDSYKNPENPNLSLDVDIRYIPIYYKVVKNAKELFPFFTPAQILFYSYLFAQAYVFESESNDKGYITHLTTQYMTDETGLSDKTIRTYLKNFQKWGLISIKAVLFNNDGVKTRIIRVLCNFLSEEFDF